MTVQEAALLDTAVGVLLRTPAASLGEVAAAAGVSRTTLHSRWPTRQALLVALAHDALDRLERAYALARLNEGSVRDALGRVITETLPLGPRVAFLLRERSLDVEADLNHRYETVDQPLLDLVERGQRDGALRTDLPAWWLTSALVSMTYAAWEAIADGRLAPRDAPDMVLTSVLDGVAAR